ncbi:MAG: hypothetical protein ABFS12_06170 [Bacteroidota bacterium]
MKTTLFNSLFTILFIIAFLLSGCSDEAIQYETNTFIKDWLIVGPFPNCEDCSTTDFHHDAKCDGFYTDYLESIGGEKNAVPTEGMKISVSEKNIERTWFKLQSTKDKIHLTDLKPKDMVVAYAFCQVESPKDQNSILSIGSNDGIRVFLNGEEIHESHEYNGRWLQADNDYVPVQLKKGINNLMLKIDQGTGDFGYVARFLDYDSTITKIRTNLDLYKRLKVVAIADTLVATFGTRDKISVLNPEGKVKIELIHEKKGKLNERTVTPGEDVEFLLKRIPKGFLTVKAEFPTSNDGVITSETRYYNGKLKRHPRVKRMTKDLTILDDQGNSFFPIGTYGAPVEDYKKLKDAGYNFVVASAENLDKVHDAGLLAAIHVHGKTPQEYYEFISKYKDHPAILCWMLYDEPGYNKADLQYIYDIYNAAYEADKVHPSYLVITNNSVYKSFGPLCDVLAIDTYPITNGTIEGVGNNIALAYKQLNNKVPIWHCGQMFTWPEQRRPNPQEHRFMTYHALMNGAKGMLWYTYKGYGQYLPVDDPELWEAQKKLLAEVNVLSPMFLKSGFGKEIQVGQGDESVKAIIKKNSIGTFVIAANISKIETIQPELKITKKYDGNINVFNENRTVVAKNGILIDSFKPLDVHIYKLK